MSTAHRHHDGFDDGGDVSSAWAGDVCCVHEVLEYLPAFKDRSKLATQATHETSLETLIKIFLRQQ